jgi:hypothetical protein
MRETGQASRAEAAHVMRPQSPVTPAATAPEATVQLQALLAHHSVLAADLMRARLRGDEDFAQAANAAVGRNTDDIAKVAESLFGAQMATRFKTLWAGHTTAFFNYARGLADKDSAVRDQARQTLTTFETNLAGVFVDASKGRLSPQTAEAAVRTHVDHLLKQADAYAARDYATADRIYREAHTHTFGLGKALAAAILPPDQAAALETPVWRLRSELCRMFAEHVELIVDATRAGVTNSPDFAEEAGALNANTRELARSIDSLFGAASATRFQSLWADHVDQIMAYTAGVAARDAKRRDDARAKLSAFESQLASFLDTATNGKLDAAHLAKDMVEHDQMLMQHADAFAAKDYRKAHDLAYETYEYAPELGGELAEAFGATIAARLPKGGPETGQGGEAAVVEHR